jgi:hypothetical protein
LVRFKADQHPFSFDWRKGTKTINILEGEGRVCCMSFGHEFAKTTKRQAKRTIQRWIADNSDVRIRQRDLEEVA